MHCAPDAAPGYRERRPIQWLALAELCSPLDLLRFVLFLEDVLFFGAGTFPPARRASESPIAIACLRLVTFFPERPLFSVPALRSFIALATFCEAFFPYLLAIAFLLGHGRTLAMVLLQTCDRSRQQLVPRILNPEQAQLRTGLLRPRCNRWGIHCFMRQQCTLSVQPAGIAGQ